jgi:uncharacterized protein (TIRG00374 family)
MLTKKRIWSISQLLLSFALLTWLIIQVGPDTILETLRGLDWRWYLLAFLLFQLNLLIRAYRWFLLLSSLDDRPPFLQLVYLYYLGFFFNNFIPSGFGGDLIKVVGIRRDYGSGSEALSSVLMDRIVGLLGSSLVAVVALFGAINGGWLADVNLPPLLVTTIVSISLGVPIGFALLRYTDPLKRLGTLIPMSRKVVNHPKVRNLAGTIRRYPLPSLAKSLLTSLPFTLILILIHYSIATALGISLPLYIFALFVPLISLVNLIPISFNGLGTREGVYLLLFVPAGVAASTAISQSLSLYIIRVCTGLIGGLLYLSRTAMNMIRLPKQGITRTKS